MGTLLMMTLGLPRHWLILPELQRVSALGTKSGDLLPVRPCPFCQISPSGLGKNHKRHSNDLRNLPLFTSCWPRSFNKQNSNLYLYLVKQSAILDIYFFYPGELAHVRTQNTWFESLPYPLLARCGQAPSHLCLGVFISKWKRIGGW